MNSNSDEQAPDNAKQKITPVYFEQAVIEPIAFAPADEKVAVRSLQLKPLNLLLTLMLLIGLTLVWFLFTAKSVVMREDHRLALSVAVQRNTTRAERGVTLLGAAQKGRAQRAGTQPSSAGDGLATESMVAEVSAAPEAAKEEEQMTYV